MIRNATNRLVSGFGIRKNAVRYLSTQQKQSYSDSENEKFGSTTEEGCVVNSFYENVILPNCTIEQHIWKNFKSWENKVATVCGVTGRQYTYAQLRDSSAAFAVRLQTEFNLKQNDVIAICLPNTPEFPIAILGAIEAGLRVTTVNPIYTADEISKQLTNSNAKAIIGSVQIFETLNNACSIAKKPMQIICVKTETGDSLPSGAIDFNQMIDTTHVDFSRLKRYDTKPDEVSLLPYSSGTTGLPKGVELTHTNIITNCDMLLAKTGTTPLVVPTSDSHQDVLPCVLPFFHIYGLTVNLFSKLALGCKLVTLPKFAPDTFLNSLVVHKGSVLHLVPPIVIFLGMQEKIEQDHLKSIRIVMSGAAPMGATDAERLLKKAPKIEFLQGYGLTESSPVVLIGSRGTKNYSSVGAPTPNTQAKIVALDDPKNIGLGVNQVGELFVRGPQVMKGYHNNQKATDEMLLKDGWLRTGDLAYYDHNNEFYITDRLKELIKVKGFQVPPAELEEILRDHPKVMDAGVVGIPHPISGEVPRAFVVPKPNVIVTEKELQDYVAKKVAVYKKLDGGVQFMESIPKNASGKILRRELKEKFC